LSTIKGQYGPRGDEPLVGDEKKERATGRFHIKGRKDHDQNPDKGQGIARQRTAVQAL